eukprot:TRINITY_DN40914_c0_g1_i1.p1 TRINITY_DN40914_c0_g1~~TRINITY_DN40914_c0_g1_i1.p1  ORF type:complete len:123 (+),score=33.61 TRINITY_DN40914_c0_g1_i1:75-443(+)
MYCYFFFFKQKTAYEMLRSLVGSEMCIRDSHQARYLPKDLRYEQRDHLDTCSPSQRSYYSRCEQYWVPDGSKAQGPPCLLHLPLHHQSPLHLPCLLYTSDAADEEDSVDLGGRRIIKKKKKE